MSYEPIRASELADYVYCHRSWWLKRVAGYDPQNIEQLAEGTTYHHKHGRLLHLAGLARLLAYILVFLAVSTFVFLLVQGF